MRGERGSAVPRLQANQQIAQVVEGAEHCLNGRKLRHRIGAALILPSFKVRGMSALLDAGVAQG